MARIRKHGRESKFEWECRKHDLALQAELEAPLEFDNYSFHKKTVLVKSGREASPAGPVRIYRPGKPSIIVPADFSVKTVGDPRCIGLRARRGHPLIER